ncbi:MAG: response regulator [Candidatus Ozemobacteraceae bacterium]
MEKPSDNDLQSQGTWQGTGTILLVDDEEGIRELCFYLLKRLGFSVLFAADGRQAVEVFQKNREIIRCVLLDLTMPHMNGEDAFWEIRLIDPNAVIIISSGYNEQDIAHRFTGENVNGFIQKPYQLSTLTDVLKSILKP